MSPELLPYLVTERRDLPVVEIGRLGQVLVTRRSLDLFYLLVDVAGVLGSDLYLFDHGGGERFAYLAQREKRSTPTAVRAPTAQPARRSVGQCTPT